MNLFIIQATGGVDKISISVSILIALDSQGTQAYFLHNIINAK